MDKINITKKLIILSFLSLILLKASIISAIITSYTPIQLEYLISNTQLGFISTIYFMFSLIGSIFWTIFLSKIKIRKTLVYGGIFWIVGIFLGIFNTNYYQLIVSMAFIGFGSDAIQIVSYNLYTDLIHQENKGKSVSLLIVIQGAGGLVGVIITGIIEGMLGLSWRTLLAIVGVTSTLVFLVSIYLVFKGNFGNLDSKKLDQDESNVIFLRLDGKVNKEIFMRTLKNKTNILVFTIFLLLLPIMQFNNIWVQKYWIDIHQLNQTMAMISMVFTSGGEFLGLIFTGWLVDKIKANKTKKIPIIGIISGTCSAPLFLVGYIMSWEMNSAPTEGMNIIEIVLYMIGEVLSDPKIFFSYVSLFVAFFVDQMMSVIMIVFLIDCNKDETKILAINIHLILINMGYLIGPVLGGFISDIFDLQVALLFVPIVCFFTGVIFIMIKKTYQYDYISGST